jgi:RNA polymerase sigma-70 factor, ECF subfamily
MTTGTIDATTTFADWAEAGTDTASGPREQLVRKLYDNHGAALQGYVTALLEGDRQTAEDVVQETALRAWRNAEKLDPAGESFRPWLLKVARRLVIDGYRRRTSRPTEIGGDTPDRLSQIDESDRKLSSLVVSEAMATLTTAHREVLLEVYYRGNTIDEAARLLGVPAGTVKSRTYYALRALRQALERRGVTRVDAA